MNGIFHSIPVLRALIPFVIGILLVPFSELDDNLLKTSLLLIAGLYISSLSSFIVRRFPAFSGIILSAFFLLFGLWRAGGEHKSMLPNNGQHVLSIEKLYGQEGANYRNALCTLRDSSSVSDVKIFALFEMKEEEVFAGERYLCDIKLNAAFPASAPGSFDRRKWANSVGAIAHTFVASENRVRVAQVSDHERGRQLIRADLTERLRFSGLSEVSVGIAQALLLGDKSGIDTRNRELFQTSGTVHVLAVSGLHVGILFFMISFALSPLGEHRMARFFKAITSVSLLWGFAFLTGSGPSVVRATMMFSIFAVAQLFDRSRSHFNSLAVAALAILIWNPALLHHLGFKLSFLAVAGILLLHGPLSRMLDIRNRVLDRIWSLACVSLAAQIATAPLVVYEFGHFPVWFLPANIVVVSLVSSLIVPLGIVILAIGKWPSIAKVPALVFDKSVALMMQFAEKIAGLPFAYPAIRIDLFQMLVIYAVIIMLVIQHKTRYRMALPIVAAMLLLFASWAWKQDSSHERRQLIVHDSKEMLITDLNGRSLAVYGKESEGTRKRVELYRNELGVDRFNWTGQDTTLGDLILNQRILFVRQNTFTDTTKLRGYDQILTGYDVPYSKRRYLKKWSARNNVEYHSLREQGAFILNISGLAD